MSVRRAAVTFFCVFGTALLVFYLGYVALFIATYKPAFVKHSQETMHEGMIVLDLDNDKLEAYRPHVSNVYYDYEGDGLAVLTGWVEPDDGILVLDYNENGLIDHGREMFMPGRGKNGLPALAALRRPGAPKIIDENHPAYERLRVWQDLNQDGISQPEELSTLAQLSIVSLSLDWQTHRHRYVGKGRMRHYARFTYASGRSPYMGDIWVPYDPEKTRNTIPYQPASHIAFLPNLPGKGALRDLHFALSNEENHAKPDSLFAHYRAVTENLTLARLLTDWPSVETEMQNVLFQWAQVDALDPRSRGPHIDARRIRFYELYRGEDFRQVGFFRKHFSTDAMGLKNPLPYAAYHTNTIYRYHLARSVSKVAAQLFPEEIFSAPAKQCLHPSGWILPEAELAPAGIDHIRTIAFTAADPDEVWMRAVQFLAYTKDLSNISDAEKKLLNKAIAGSARTIQSWDQAVHLTEEKYGNILTPPG